MLIRMRQKGNTNTDIFLVRMVEILANEGSSDGGEFIDRGLVKRPGYY